MSNESLRTKVIQGGAYLIVRRAIGFIISFGGILLLTRFIGASQYGMYVTIFTITSYLIEICSMGISSYLIREEGEMQRTHFDLAFTFVLITTVSAILLGFGLSFFLESWLDNTAIQAPFMLMLLVMPSKALLLPVMSKLERELDFTKIAFLEMYTQIVYYACALLLGYLGFGIWAPVVGNLMQGVAAIIICLCFSTYRPNFYWSNALIKKMFKYGVSNTISERVWGLRVLVNPLIVGKFIGSEGVACISLTIRLLEALSFVNGAIARIAFPLLSKVQNDKLRLENAIRELMVIQLFSLAPFLIGFAMFSRWFIPFFFGKEWMTILQIYPYVAIGLIVNCMFSLHVSVLYVRGFNWEVTKFNLVHVILFAAAAILLVPSMGLNGYAAAEIIALVSYYVIHISVVRKYQVHYRMAFYYALAVIPSMFFPKVGMPWACLLITPLLWFVFSKKSRNQMLMYSKQIIRKRTLEPV